jgi:hypothetical protein
MRFFLSCQQSPVRHAVPAYSFWETYFKRGLEEAGHEWVEAEGLDWASLLVEEDDSKRRATWQKALASIQEHHRHKPIDLLLGYLFPAQVDPDAIRKIQALGIPCVNFFCDNVREYRSVPEPFKPFDLHWVPEYKALAMYKRAGLQHVHAPMPCWIAPVHRTWRHDERYGPTFIGSWDLQRDALLCDAIERGAPLTVRGVGWKDSSVSPSIRGQRTAAAEKLSRQFRLIQHQGVLSPLWKMTYRLRREHRTSLSSQYFHSPADDYIAMTQESSITLGVNRYPSYRRPFWFPDTYSRMRDIEAPMMGACYLTEWTEGLDQLYDLGSEIETYRSPEEMVEQIRRLSADEMLRRELRRRGQQRALSEHSIGHSINKVIDALGLARIGNRITVAVSREVVN